MGEIKARRTTLGPAYNMFPCNKDLTIASLIYCRACILSLTKMLKRLVTNEHIFTDRKGK